MKTVILLLLFVQISAFAKANKIERSKVSTDHSFDDASVNGRYHTSGEAIATVEDEKVLNDLLSVRKDFKDRVKKSYLEQ